MMSENTFPTDDDTVDIQPWPVAELVGRAVVLATVARRGMLDVDETRDLLEVETDQFDLSTWARTELQGWLTQRDVELVTKPAGEMNEQEISECNDALVGASTIAWALRGIDTDHLPVPNDGAAEHATLEWAAEPWKKVRPLQQRARLRSVEDLAAERERWELWYWRAVDVGDNLEDVSDVIDEVDDAGLIRVVQHDFSTDRGVPFSRLDPETRDDIAWLAEIRLKTLNWVCGFGASWNAAPLYLDD